MEWLVALLIVLFVTLLVGGAFAAAGARGPWPGVIWFFLVLFFATWAIGAWAQPVGPRAWGVHWLTFLVVALLIALLIAAATPRERYASRNRAPEELPLERDTATEPEAETRRDLPEREAQTAATATAVGVFFWIFLVAAATLLLLSLLFAPLT